MTRQSIKLVLIAVFVGGALLIWISEPSATSATPDEVLEQISNYRTWTRVTKEQIKGASFASLLKVVPDPKPADGEYQIDPAGGG